jgi:hypothetical protein
LSYGLQYRNEIKEAVRIFRPVLKSLKIRNDTEHPIVRFVEFDHLRHLNLDECSVQVIVADTKASGMFIAKYTEQGLFQAYIILSRKLYDNQDKETREMRKIAGVHEFVHFIAAVYVATVTGTIELRAKLLNRLQDNVRNLPESNLMLLYNALKSNIEQENIPPELTDEHFRIGDEGQTPDYNLLFLHFMFTRELFEEYFDKDSQSRFKELLKAGDNGEATSLLIDTLNRAASDKDVPLKMATNQLMQWVHVYTRPNSAAA